MPRDDEVMMLRDRLAAMLMAVIWSIGVGSAADGAAARGGQDGNELRPGLVAVYSPVQGQRRVGQVARVDADVQCLWGDASPDPRVPAGRFAARWQGKLLVPTNGKYRLHLYLQGAATVQLAGQNVLDGRSDRPGWLSTRSIELQRGYHRLAIAFQKTAEAAQIGLYWESGRFALEPVTSRWLFHAPGQRGAGPRDFEIGERLVQVYRCGACHEIAIGESALKAPSLLRLAGNIDPEWLTRWLQSPHQMHADAKMPEFGLGESDARAIASYLLAASAEAAKAGTSKAQAGDPQKGEALFRSVGCLGCHRLGDDGHTGLFGGGALDGVAEKRPAHFFATWLTHPERLNADHRMPVFRLAEQQLRDLSAFLAGLAAKRQAGATPKEERPDPAVAARGKQLIAQLRCAACHQIPGVEAPRHIAIDARATKSSCLRKPNVAMGRPGFQLPESDRSAIAVYLSELPSKPAPRSTFERGRMLFVQRNCTGCHARDLEQGLQFGVTPDETGRIDVDRARQRGELQPPSLTAAGDKFHDETLGQLVQGGLPRYRPWLQVRMPRFAHSDSERAALVAFLAGHDRIPDAPPGGQRGGAIDDPARALVAGQRLVSSRGFGCMSCHAVGKHVPLDVDTSARGSDLLGIGKRLRRAWFLRWTRDPVRMVPGMEMPAIAVPVAGVLGGRLDAQIESLWQALNSEAFVVPSSGEWAEQVLALRPGDRPAVLRDVVFDAPPGSGWCARCLAIGLPNQHNVLFDLETFAMRAWWLGDFARERTQGKTWLWEPGGLQFLPTVPQRAAVVLRDRRSGRLLTPLKEGQTVGWLRHWEHRDGAVQFAYRLRFPGDAWVTVAESISPLPDQNGFARGLAVSDVPGNFEPVFLHKGSAGTTARANELAQAGSLGRFGIAAGRRSKWEPFDLQREDGDGAVYYGFAMSKDADTDLYRARLNYHSEVASLGESDAGDQAPVPSATQPVRLSVVPGYEAVRLPLDPSVMPTAIAFRPDGTPLVCSLKGQVLLAIDSDGDGLEDTWQPFSDHLAAPFGVLAEGDAVIVSHKPEVVRLVDRDGDGRADRTEVVATGWGYNDNYHDWTFGLVRDARDRLYVTLGSDYQQSGRAKESSYLRGHALRIDAAAPSGGGVGVVEDLASGFRFSAGIAINRGGAVFVTDNQGVQNTFNEINHLVPGSRYGVPGLTDPPAGDDARTLRLPAVQVPHPLTRSVNGICFLDSDGRFGPFEGQGIGCEYDTRALMRFSLQPVGNTYQGACYRFSLPDGETPAEAAPGPGTGSGFLGPIACAVSPRGEIYIGGIRDSGWGAGNNVGELVRLKPKGPLPAGIAEVRAVPEGFRIDFTGRVDAGKAAQPANFLVSSYRRIWKGNYATPDSNRRNEQIVAALVQPGRRSVVLQLAKLRPGFVYDLHVGAVTTGAKPLWPADAYYTLNAVPAHDQKK